MNICSKQSLSGASAPSQIYPILLEQANGDESLASQYMAYFKSDSFISLFGDYISDFEKPFSEREISSERINDVGEPKLFKETDYTGKFEGKYYFLDKNNIKNYYPHTGLNSVLNLNRINSLTSTLASQYILNYFTGLKNIASPDFDAGIKKTLKEFITSKLIERRDELNSLGGFRNKINAKIITDVLKHTDELNLLVIDHLSTLKLKYVESEEEISNEGNNEENTKDTPFNMSSFEKNYKQNINAEIKLLLSLIENNEPNGKDETLGENKFYKYEFVYNTILKILSGTHVPYDANKFDYYYNKLRHKSEFIPMLKEVVELLEHPSIQNDHSLKNKFVQSFELNKNIFLTYQFEKLEDSITFKNFDVSELNSNKNKIRNEWNINFSKVALKEKVQADKNIIKTIDQAKIKLLLEESDNLFKSAPRNFETLTEDQYLDYYNKIYNFLHSLGVNVTEEGFTYYIKNSSRDIYSLSDNLKSILNVNNKITYFLKDINNLKVKNEFDELLKHENIFLNLAEGESIFYTDTSDASFYSAGMTYWGFSKPSYIANKTKEIKENPNFFKNLKESSSFYKNSRVLKYLEAEDVDGSEMKEVEKSKRRDQFNEGIFNTFQLTGDTNKTVNNKEITANDEIVLSLNTMLSFKIGQNPFIRTTTAADKSSQRVIQLPKELFLNSNYNNDTKTISDKVLNVLYDYWFDEYSRAYEASLEIEEAKNSGDTSKLYKNYHYKGNFDFTQGNALQSQLFPSLSPVFKKIDDNVIVEQPSLGISLYDPSTGYPILPEGLSQENKEIVKKHIKDILVDRIIATEKELNTIGLFSGKGNEITTNLNIDHNIYKEYADANINLKNTRFQIAADFLINGIMVNVEFSKLYTGDYAYYKNMVDYKKRIPATYTDGLYLNPTEDRKTFKISVISSVEGSYNRKEEFDELVQEGILSKDIADYYAPDKKGKINIADGQAWITPLRWKHIMQDLGKWNDKYSLVYDKIMSDGYLTPSELKIAMQPLKGVYFDVVNGKPTFLKYSQAVLIPSLIKGTSLETIYNRMVDPNIGFDELLTEDAIKAGLMSPVKTHSSEDANIVDSKFNVDDLAVYELNNKSYKLQQDLPTKLNKDTELGSQIQKNILLGLKFNPNTKFEYKGEQYTNEEMIDLINDKIGEMSFDGLSKFYKSLGISSDGVIKNKHIFLNNLANQLSSQNGDLNVVEALRTGVNPFGIVSASQKITQLFASKALKNIVKIKTNGGSFIQMSGYGLNFNQAVSSGVRMTPWALKNKNNENETYSYSIMKDSNGNIIYGENGKPKIKPAGMFVPGHFIAKYIPNYRQMTDEQLFGTFNPETNSYENGIIDEKILKNWIGYRIPNQGLSSNDAFEIAGILPDGLGDTIIAYTGLTTKTGSDFDIDKLYFMMPYIKPTYRFDDTNVYINTRRELQKMFKAETYDETLRNVQEFFENIISQDESLDVTVYDFESIVDLIYEDYNSTSNIDGYEALADIIYDTQSLIIEDLSEFRNIIFTKLPSKLEYETEGYKGKANDLIELYRSIILNADVLNEVLTPIDFDFFSNDIKAFNPEQNLNTDIDSFDMLKDIKLKSEFKAGKAGVGMEANALIDYIKGSIAELTLDQYIGAGNIDDNGNTKLDQEFSSELTNEELKLYVENLNKVTGKNYKTSDFEHLKSIKIANTLSAILNAFVDIAKDPYITRGNWNTVTTNTGNLLVRSGVHPFIVNAFIGHPVIKQYIQFQTNKESITVDETGKMFDKFKAEIFKTSKLMQENFITLNTKSYSYSELLEILFEKDYEAVLSFNSSDLIKKFNSRRVEVIRNGQKITVPAFPKKILDENSEQINIFINTAAEALNVYLKSFKETNVFPSLEMLYNHNSEMNGFQSLETDGFIFSKFNSLMKISKEMKDNVAASRSDVEGFGKSIGDLISKNNKIRRLLGKPIRDKEGKIIGYDESNLTIKNFNKKFSKDGKKTMLGYYTENIIFNMINIVKNNPELFFEAQPLLVNVKNIMSKELHGTDYIENSELAEKIDILLKGLIFSDFKLFKTSTDQFRYLLSKKFIEEFKEFKEKNNYLILNELELSSGIHAHNIGMPNRNRNTASKKEITDSWLNMFNNPEHRSMAIKLAKYSHITSSFELNKSQFFTYLPYEMMVAYNINDYLNNFNDNYSSKIDTIIEEIYKNNHEDDKIVPKVQKKDMVSYQKINYPEFINHPEILNNPNFTKVIFKLKSESTENPKRYLKMKVGPNYLLYKLGFRDSQGNYTYIREFEKGISNKGNFIYDYSLDGEYKYFKPNNEYVDKIKEILSNNIIEEHMFYKNSNDLFVEDFEIFKKSVSITPQNYTRKFANQNKDTLFVYTENVHSLINAPNVSGGGTAVIRPEINAFPIITKKLYNYKTKENKDFEDNDVDFNTFTSVNTTAINNIINSKYEKMIVPKGFATDKAKLPLRFSEWLKDQLLNKLGIETKIINFNDGMTGLQTAGVSDLNVNVESKNTPVEYTDMSEINIHSGGAHGVDLEGDNISVDYGIKNRYHYYIKGTKFKPFGGNTSIENKELIEEAKNEAEQSISNLKRIKTDAFDLIVRNWFQVKNSDQIFAFAQLVQKGRRNSKGYTNDLEFDYVDGGTGYAVEMAIRHNKDVYVFDKNTNIWLQYNHTKQRFETLTETPLIGKKNIAIIGTREINLPIKNAIKRLFEKASNNLNNTPIIENTNKQLEMFEENNTIKPELNDSRMGEESLKSHKELLLLQNPNFTNEEVNEVLNIKNYDELGEFIKRKCK